MGYCCRLARWRYLVSDRPGGGRRGTREAARTGRALRDYLGAMARNASDGPVLAFVRAGTHLL